VAELIPLPTNRIEPAARLMARRWHIVSVLPIPMTVLLGMAMMLLLGPEPVFAFLDRLGFNRGGVDGRVAALIIFGIPAAITVALHRKAHRVAAIAKLATTDASLKWRLVGHTISAGGVAPRPELAFTVTRRIRQSLTALPRATARS
jgi:hypothetical protein